MISKFRTQIVSEHTSITFPSISRKPSMITREFCTVKGITMKKALMVICTLPCLNLFSQKDWNCLVGSGPMVPLWMLDWGKASSPLGNCYIEKWNLGYDQIEPYSVLLGLGQQPTKTHKFSLVVVSCSIQTRCFAPIDDYQTKSSTCLRKLPWSSKI